MSDTVLALDIGGTHVSAGRVDLRSRSVQERVRVPLPSDADREALLARIGGALRDVVDGAVARVGVAVPGPFDLEGGVSLLRHKLLPLYGVDLRRHLGALFPTPDPGITFVNDADAFLLGEWWAGAATGHRRVVGVTLGTGLGSAFLADGRIVDTGPTVPPEGSLHLVLHRGAPAEEAISRDALVNGYGDARLDVVEIAARARRGDERAQRVFSDLGENLGEVLAPWIGSFRPTCLVVGGSIAGAWDLLGPSLRAALHDAGTLETVQPAALLDEAALLGAALVAAEA